MNSYGYCDRIEGVAGASVAKPRAGGSKTAMAQRGASSSGTESRESAATELAAAYRTARGAPTARMPALRGLLRGYLDACSALVDGIPAARRRAKVDKYLARLHELRSCSLPQDAWQLDVIEWLRSEGDAVRYLKKS